MGFCCGEAFGPRAALMYSPSVKHQLIITGMIREHPLGNTPRWLSCSGAHTNVVVAMYQYSSTSLSPTCIDIYGVVLCNGISSNPHPILPPCPSTQSPPGYASFEPFHL